MGSRRRAVVFVRMSTEELALLDQLVAYLVARQPFWRVTRPDAIRFAMSKTQAQLLPESKNSK